MWMITKDMETIDSWKRNTPRRYGRSPERKGAFPPFPLQEKVTCTPADTMFILPFY